MSWEIERVWWLSWARTLVSTDIWCTHTEEFKIQNYSKFKNSKIRSTKKEKKFPTHSARTYSHTLGFVLASNKFKMWQFSRLHLVTSNAQKKWKIENLFHEIVLPRTLDNKYTKKIFVIIRFHLGDRWYRRQWQKIIKINYFVFHELHSDRKRIFFEVKQFVSKKYV